MGSPIVLLEVEFVDDTLPGYYSVPMMVREFDVRRVLIRCLRSSKKDVGKDELEE